MNSFHKAIADAISKNNNNSSQAWEDVRQFLDMCIKTQPIRIHDNKNEGVFYHNDMPAVDISKINQEEGLSYAIFNSREHLNIPKKIIGYEAYLLRQPEQFLKAQTVKCDLIAYNSDPHDLGLTAIEVKKDPSQENTSLEFGMLQARAYGYLLTRLHAMEIDSLKKQISYCLKNYYNNDDYDGKIKYISFALAAPNSYFQKLLRNNPDIRNFLKPLEEDYFTLGFDGYWVIEEPCDPTYKGHPKKNKCEPILDPSSTPNIILCKNFDQLHERVSQ